MQDFRFLEKFYKAFSWCEENNARIYPVPKGKEFILVYEINGLAKTSGKVYSKKELDQKVKEFYIYLCEKLSNE